MRSPPGGVAGVPHGVAAPRPARTAAPPRATHHPHTGTLSASELDARLDVAAGTRRLDLSECGLTEVPAGVLALTDLEELSLAGNALTTLPPGLTDLPLTRLQLAGNCLTELPASLGRLTRLQGLWVHGNALTSLPSGVGGCMSLASLSAAGNALTSLPASFGDLSSLTEAGLAGNTLARLPAEWEGLTALKTIKLNGNALTSLPPSLASLPSLASIALQANGGLISLPEELADAPTLADVNVADCGLIALPRGLGGLTALTTLTAYGNALTDLPPGLASAPALQRLWLEGNPLAGAALEQLVVDAGRAAAARGNGGGNGASSSSPPSLRVGLDARQAASISSALLAAAGPAVTVCRVAADGPGYWKLELAPPSTLRSSTAPASSLSHDLTDSRGSPGRRALIVAFGSAPGEPNWGGLLSRLRADASEAAHAAFDVLYVVDGARSWYGGGGPDADAWAERVAAVAAPYGGATVLIGDSMGATAALAVAGATPPGSTVIAFCPQVDLGTASIRPGGVTPEWTAALSTRVRTSTATAAAAGGRVAVHVGSWQHDVDQASSLAAAGALVKVWSVPSHRLAAALDSRGELLPLVRRAVLAAMGFADGRDVRVANVL